MAFGSVAIGWCHPDVWPGAPQFYGCLRDTFRVDRHGARRIQDREIEVVGSQIDAERNDIVEGFLAHPDQPAWLLMIDADMVWVPDDVTRLLDAADEKTAPVMAGLCFAESRQNRGELWPTMMVFVPGEHGEAVGLKRIKEWPRGEVCKVDATGAAFLLVHRSVFERLREVMGESHPAPWFAVTYSAAERFGEDVTFFMRLRMLEIPVFVHTGVSVGHVKLRVLTEAMYDEQQGRRPALAVVE
jgi:hypothetical protein